MLQPLSWTGGDSLPSNALEIYDTGAAMPPRKILSLGADEPFLIEEALGVQSFAHTTGKHNGTAG